MINILASILRPFIHLLKFLTPLFDLLARIWVSYIFLLAGINKVENWNSTLLLFTYEYHVPLLSPHVATIVGTLAEFILPIMLTFGLGGRICIFVFFIYNLMAVISYPFLWTPDGQNGLYEHISWGLLLGLLMCHGPGKLSLDYLIKRKFGFLLDKNKDV